MTELTDEEKIRQYNMLAGLMDHIGAPTHVELEDGELGGEFSLYGRVQRACGLVPDEHRWDYNIGPHISLKYHLRAAHLWSTELHDLLVDIHSGYRGNKEWQPQFTSDVKDYVVDACVLVGQVRNLIDGALDLLPKKKKVK